MKPAQKDISDIGKIPKPHVKAKKPREDMKGIVEVSGKAKKARKDIKDTVETSGKAVKPQKHVENISEHRGNIGKIAINPKDIVIKPVTKPFADRIIKSLHYSGKVTANSQLCFGAFVGDRCLGAIQYGPSIDKRKILPLCPGTKWNDYFELNRLAFSDELPRNSESRCLAITFKLMKKHYPHIKWIVTFPDATQCGDGTIYRAAGFHLIQINKNNTMLKLPDGQVFAGHGQTKIICKKTLDNNPMKNTSWWRKHGGATPLPGFQVKYIYFLDKSYKDRLTVPILPYSAIAEAGASMYKGVKSVVSGQ